MEKPKHPEVVGTTEPGVAPTITWDPEADTLHASGFKISLHGQVYHGPHQVLEALARLLVRHHQVALGASEPVPGHLAAADQYLPSEPPIPIETRRPERRLLDDRRTPAQKMEEVSNRLQRRRLAQGAIVGALSGQPLPYAVGVLTAAMSLEDVEQLAKTLMELPRDGN